MATTRMWAPLAFLVTSCALELVKGQQEDFLLLWSVREFGGRNRVDVSVGHPTTWVSDLLSNGTLPVSYPIAFQGHPYVFGKMAIDYGGNKMFWHDSYGSRIRSTSVRDLQTYTVTTHDVPCSNQVNGLTYDWLAKNIYLTDPINKRIVMAPASNKGVHHVVVSDVITPYGIDVHPQSSQLFWSDTSRNKIYASNLLGNERKTLAIGGNPTVLRVEGDWLYWLDTDLGLIQRISVYGSSRSVIIRDSELRRFVAFSIFEDNFFAADAIDELHVYQRNTTSGHYLGVVLTLDSAIRSHDVVLFGPHKQPAYFRPCSAIFCRGICVGLNRNTDATCINGDRIATTQRTGAGDRSTTTQRTGAGDRSTTTHRTGAGDRKTTTQRTAADHGGRCVASTFAITVGLLTHFLVFP